MIDFELLNIKRHKNAHIHIQFDEMDMDYGCCRWWITEMNEVFALSYDILTS